MSRDISDHFLIPDKEFRQKLFSKLAAGSENINTESISSAIAVFEMAQNIQNALILHFSRYDLTQARFVVLLTIYSDEKKSWSSAELAAAVKVRPPTMTGILDVLIKGKFIERKSDKDDRRKVIITLTDKGRKKISEVLPDHFKRISASFENLLNEKNRREIRHLSGEISKSIELLLEGV